MTIVAVLLYTRALRNGRWLDWLAASVAASATIFIRQFGIAILGGLALVWLWDRRRFARLGQYGVGTLLPTISTLWQLQQGWNQSNWAQTLLLHRQKAILLGRQLPQGLALANPRAGRIHRLVPAAGCACCGSGRLARAAIKVSPASDSQTETPRRATASPSRELRLAAELFGWLILLLASVAYGARVLGVSWLMPYLPWFFEILKLLGLKAELPATLLTIAGGVLFAHFFARRYLVAANRPRLEQGLLDAATFVSLLMALVFFVFGDKDVLIFLPLGGDRRR